MVTHDGDFHADDVFACATFFLWAEKKNNKIKIIRSREKEIIKKAGIVVDVGGICDTEKNRFDHHQKEGTGKRENGIPYASFGLVWKKYGQEICNDKEVADRIDKELIMPIDARDNGINISIANEFGVVEHDTTRMLCNFNLTWQEIKQSPSEQFEKALYFAKEILLREIAWARALIDGEKETIKSIKFVVYPRKDEKEWHVRVGRDNLEDYNSDRVKFPKEWWSLRDDNLVKISNIKDAVFCINGGWLAVNKTKEGAIQIAQKALQGI